MPVLVHLDLDMQPVEALANRLSPQEIGRRAHAALGEAGHYLRGQVQDRTPKDTGLTAGRIFTDVYGRTIGDMYGVVASPDAHMLVLEKGRKPGARRPPSGPIELWVKRKGLATGANIRSVAFLIARAIGRRGLPAHHMFEKAAQEGRPTVRRIWAKHFQDL